MDKTLVSQLVEERDVVTVSLSQPIDQVIEILSVPVKDEEGKWIGLVDMLDILQYALDVSFASVESRTAPTSKDLHADTVEQQMARMAQFSLRTLSETDAIDLSHRNPYTIICSDDCLRDALAAYARGVHRLIVVDDQLEPKAVLSQSRVFGTALKEGDYLKEVVTANKSMTVLDAFFLMWRKDVSGIAIVRDDGSLWDVLSSSDVKHFADFGYPKLLLTLEQFIENYRSNTLIEDAGFVRMDSTVGQAVKVMKDKKYHRCFVLSEDDKPVGVVTYTDVAEALYQKL